MIKAYWTKSTVRFPPKLYHEVHKLAADLTYKEGRSVCAAEVVRRAVKAYLRNNNGG